jgi:hypothetical protein
LTGRVFFHHVLYVAAMGGMGTVLTWRIALRMLQGRMAAAWPVALLLAAPLTVLGIYCILPLPSYDCDCAFFVLVAVWLLLRLEANTEAQTGSRGIAHGLVTGAALCLPVFFKQNIGLPFLASCLAVVVLLVLVQCFFPKHMGGTIPRGVLLAVLAGACATLGMAALLLQATVGLGNYLHWTIEFAAQRRLPGVREMVSVYLDPSLLWTLPCVVAALVLLRTAIGKARWAQVAALALLAAPFVFTLYSLILYDDADERGDTLLALWPLLLILAAALALFNLFRLRGNLSLRGFLPLVLLGTINATFMSQQLWGSTYAIWPLLVLLVAEMLVFLGTPAELGEAKRLPAFAIAGVFSVTLTICGAFYTASEERLSYADFPDGAVQHSAFPALAGMSTTGPYLANFDELLRYAETHIPARDGLILLPGEDPFYFASGRAPQFPVLLFDPATDPYSAVQVLDEVRRRNIRWLVVKRALQMKADPTPQREATLTALAGEFTLVARLRGYEVYRR